MRIELNGESLDVDSELLSDILNECGYSHARIATAVNGDFVASAARANTPLQEGDRLEVVAPIAGG